MGSKTCLAAAALLSFLSACSTLPETQSATSINSWGRGTQRLTAGASYTNTEIDAGPTDIDTDIFRIDGEYGYLIDENVEVNGTVTYLNQDSGTGDSSALGFLGGARYYVTTPDSDNPSAIYGEAKVGLLHADNGRNDQTDPALGLGGGVIWWPWGAAQGLSFDLSFDWLTSADFESLGAGIAMSFWW